MTRNTRIALFLMGELPDAYAPMGFDFWASTPYLRMNCFIQRLQQCDGVRKQDHYA